MEHDGSAPKRDQIEQHLQEIWDTLDRVSALDAIGALCGAIDSQRQPLEALDRVAFGFDTSAVFRIGMGTRGSDILDYLRTKHRGPIILPGQAIQELWNNQYVSVSNDARDLVKNLTDIKTKIEKIDIDLGDEGVVLVDAIEAVMTIHGDVLDGSYHKSYKQTLELLRERASIPFVPRERFHSLTAVRQATKCPPGFRDIGDGDFFIWADFLLGIKQASPDTYDLVVFVSEDTKKDWSSLNNAHPLLVAEVDALVAKPLEIWDLAKLGKFVHLT